MRMLTMPLNLVGCLFALSSIALAQDPEIPQNFQPEPDLHTEMLELIREIEGTLVRIDLELFDAGTGELPLAPVGDSGVEKLLLSSRSKMQGVIDGIDRIFEIRDHHQAGGT